MEETDDETLPLRAINAFTFCPRLMWLEYVDQEFADNQHTVEGSHVHRNVDRPGGSMDAPNGDDEETWQTRSLWLSSEDLGVNGKVDLVEPDGDGHVMPVDTKKGRPDREGHLWPADRVQLSLQALLLEEAGYTCRKIAAWYHSARKRVVEDFTESVRAEAIEAVSRAHELYETKIPPAPLVDSPKCGGCSLAPICLPDEMNALDGLEETPRVLVPQEYRLPAYVSEAGSKVGLSKRVLKVRPRPGSESKKKELGLEKISQLNLMGGVQVTTQALQACLRRDIPVSFFSSGGFYYGRAMSTTSRSVRVRIAQFREAGDQIGLEIARVLVSDKIHNARVFLRRNAESATDEIRALKRIRGSAARADTRQKLLGFEGESARIFWKCYSERLAQHDSCWQMKGRNRKPPEDPTNAMLSYGYALLVKDCQLAAESVGLDAFYGVYHTAHHGRPSMALDLMEPFRRLIVDSVVFQMIRRGEVLETDFICSGQGVAMKKKARNALIAAYERRMSETIQHPLFDYSISYRRTLAVQARLLARTLTGELDDFPNFRTR